MHVLLVDGNRQEIRSLQEALAMAEGEIQLDAVERLATALDRLSAGDVDVVMLDLDLPDSTGLPTFHAVQAHAPEVPVVVLAGLDDDGSAIRAVQQGAHDLVGREHL